jgi:hypothetical protein
VTKASAGLAAAAIISSYHQQLSSSLVIGKVAAQRDERTFSQSSSNRTARARIPEGN